MDRNIIIVNEILNYLRHRHEIEYKGKMKVTIESVLKNSTGDERINSYNIAIRLSQEQMPLNIGGSFNTDTEFIDYICKEIDKRKLYNYVLFRAINYGPKQSK